MKYSIKIVTASLVLAAAAAVGVNAQPPEHAIERSQSAQMQRGNGGVGGQAFAQQERKPIHAQERQSEASERRAENKQRIEAHRSSIRENVCKRRHDNLSTAIPKLATSSSTLLERFNLIYERVDNFYTSESLDVENYDSLKAAVEEAKAQATTSVDMVQEYKFALDCETPGVGQQLVEFRSSVRIAHDDLKQYRQALVDYTQGVRASAEDSEAASE